MRLAVRGGRLLDPANGVDGRHDVFLADGRVAAVDAAPDGFRVDREIDASGRLVLPGLVEVSAHLGGGDPAVALDHETRAAVASGITTLCTPPDLEPCVDTPAAAELVHLRAGQHGHARVVTVGGLTRGLAGESLTEMGALREIGCVALSNGRRPVTNSLILRRALEYAASHDMTVLLTAEDTGLRDEGCAHEGAVATRLGLPGIPSAAETVGVARDLAIVELTGARAHFCRLSTAGAVAQVAEARARGLPVSADVAVHQLYLTEADVESFDTLCHTDPPLRTDADRQALRRGVAEGAVEVLTSDHRPLGADAKRAPFPATAPGISGLETLLSLTLELVDAGLLELSEAVRRITAAPAGLLGLDCGQLAPGAPADLCVVDPGARRRLDEDAMLSLGRNTPFVGRELSGAVTHTVLDGRIVHAESD